MSIFNDKSLKSVAEAAAKIMAETSHGSTPKTPKEKSLAALAHPKDKITHKDVLVGRGVLKKEEKEELDEAFPTVADGEKSLKAKEGKTTHGKITKTKTGMKHERDYDDQPEPEVKRGRGRPKKRLSEMRQEYFNYFEEEVDNETFTKELEDQKAKFDGKKKGADVAKPSVQAVKQEEVELDEEQLDELSKATLGSYAKKASSSMVANALHSGYVRGSDTGHNLAVGKKGKQKDNSKLASQSHNEMKKREAGLGKAISRLAKEEVEQIDEVSPPGREDQVKALKKVPGIDNPWAVAWASYRKSHPKKSKE